MSDPAAPADAVVAAVGPALSAPEVQRREAVLVTGPWLAGSTGLVAVLRARLPEHTFVEAGEMAPGEAPAAVVFVTSAIGPMTESDCVLVDSVCRHTDLVIGAVAKIDAHRNWREVLAADREALARRSPRYRDMPWVGVAAAPDLGDPAVGDLVAILADRLADASLARRNRLRSWESRLVASIERCGALGAGADRQARITALRAQREDVRRERRLTRAERTIALRSQMQQARVQLTYFARNRCTSVRSELQEDAAGMSRGGIGQFETYVRRRVCDVVGEVDEGITRHIGDVASELGLGAPPEPGRQATPPGVDSAPVRSRTLETRLMMVLGAGFGLGVALAVSRLFAGLAPGLTIAGLVVGGLAGLLLTVWVVGIRALLHDRAVLDRWVVDVTASLRSSVDELVATRVVAAEAALTSELAARDEEDGRLAAERIAGIDADLGEHAAQTARAAAERDRQLPPLRRALDAVRAELTRPRHPATGDG